MHLTSHALAPLLQQGDATLTSPRMQLLWNSVGVQIKSFSIFTKQICSTTLQTTRNTLLTGCIFAFD